MKAFQKDDKIILRNEDKKEIENSINILSKEFERLQKCCEDRSLEMFPVDVIRRIVENTNKIKRMGRKVEISEKYLDYVVENKEAFGYFQSQIQEYNEKIENFKQKINVLKRYASRIENEILNIEEDE